MALIRGTLHVHVAFDWGDEVNLDKARHLVPAEVSACIATAAADTEFDRFSPPAVAFPARPDRGHAAGTR